MPRSYRDGQDLTIGTCSCCPTPKDKTMPELYLAIGQSNCIDGKAKRSIVIVQASQGESSSAGAEVFDLRHSSSWSGEGWVEATPCNCSLDTYCPKCDGGEA